MRIIAVLFSIIIIYGAGFSRNVAVATEILAIQFGNLKPNDLVWNKSNDLEKIVLSQDGIEFHSTGADPYSIGPEFNFPSNKPLFVEITFKSERPGSAQLFYFEDQASESNSIRFSCFDDKWTTVKVALPKLWRKTRFRFDPPPGTGKTVLKKLVFSERNIIEDPDFSLNSPPPLDENVIQLKNKNLTFLQSRTSWNNCRIKFEDKIIAMTHPDFRIVIQRRNGAPTSFQPNKLIRKRSRIVLNQNSIESYIKFIDPDRDEWRLLRIVKPMKEAPGFEISTTVQISMDKKIFYFPAIKLFSAKDSPLLDKHLSQATVPGLEYLALEPSSSEKDLIGPQSWRKLPKINQLTWPMMAIVRDNISTSMIWDSNESLNSNIGPLFDSPDRIFNTRGHVMGMVMPMNKEMNRPSEKILPYEPITIPANTRKSINVKIIVEDAQSVIPAIKRFSDINGLPQLPKLPPFEDYSKTAIYGWLKSKARAPGGFRHALWLDIFKPQWRLDTACFQLWLAKYVTTKPVHASTKNDLLEASREVIGKAGLSNSFNSALGHNRGIWPALVLGNYEKIYQPSQNLLTQKLSAFNDNYRVHLSAQKNSEGPKALDATHDLDSTNGHTANIIADVIELSILTGNHQALKTSLEQLEHLNEEGFRVPRGAQPWEVPFHTPDILASAYLLRANNLAYLATGNEKFIDMAEGWAWSGLPFVFLNRGENIIGNYSTIPVFGATHYVAPNWIGLPVQWCGLVYAHQLYLLNELRPAGQWKALADGITITGIQHTWPISDKERGGLLPDYFNLTHQFRDGPAINPGTLQINIPYLYDLPKLYNLKAYPEYGFSILTGASIAVIEGSKFDDQISFKLTPQLGKNNLVLIHSHSSNDFSNEISLLNNEDQNNSSRVKKISNSLQMCEIKSPHRLHIEMLKPLNQESQ